MAFPGTFDVDPERKFVLHTPKGFLVFNVGQTTPNVPEEYRERLEKEGVIEKQEARPEAAAQPREAASRPARKLKSSEADEDEAPAG